MKIQQKCTVSLAFHFQWSRPRAFNNYGNCAYYTMLGAVAKGDLSWREHLSVRSISSYQLTDSILIGSSSLQFIVMTNTHIFQANCKEP